MGYSNDFKNITNSTVTVFFVFSFFLGKRNMRGVFTCFYDVFYYSFLRVVYLHGS